MEVETMLEEVDEKEKKGKTIETYNTYWILRQLDWWRRQRTVGGVEERLRRMRKKS